MDIGILRMIAELGEIMEATNAFANAIAGWHYILSSSCRNQTHARWKRQGFLQAAMDIIDGLIGVSFVVFLIGLVVWLIL
jgi:hypothetical protein